MNRSSLNRRGLLVASGAGVAFAGLGGSFAAAQKKPNLVITDPGGPLQAALKRFVYEPFTAETGIAIDFGPRPNMALGILKAMVQTKQVEWSATYLTDYLVKTAEMQGILEPIDYSVFDKQKMAEMMPGVLETYGVGTSTFAYVKAYNTDIWPAGKGPSTWVDFWDVKKFPGRRGMEGSGIGPLVAALFADGVPADKIFPLDADRAFRKLNEIRPHVAIFTGPSAQQTQIIVNREVDLAHISAARAQQGIDTGAPFHLDWNQGYYHTQSWVVPKGAKNLPEIMKFLAFSIDAERHAKVFASSASGPENLAAYKYIDPKRASVLPTYPANLGKMLRVDAAWLAQHVSELEARWQKWLAG